MANSPKAPPPLIDASSRASTDAIHQYVRGRIVSGHLAAGATLSQAKVAAECGVSRGPVREAFRLLEREGLIEVAMNQRAKVAPMSIADIEHTYALRVVNESLALAVSIPSFTTADLDDMDRIVTAVEGADPTGFDAWEGQHQRFHRLLLAHAGDGMLRSLSIWADHTERYRRAYIADTAGGWAVGATEHSQLVRLCRAGDVPLATGLLARHLARAGLNLVSVVDPIHTSVLLHAAVEQVTNSTIQY